MASTHVSTHSNAPSQPSVNTLAGPLVEALIRERKALRLGTVELPGGSTLVDAGIAEPGGLEAGRRIAEICLGGLGEVQLSAGSSSWPLQLFVHTSNPVLACLGSQYAGWSLSHGKGKEGFSALGSGPGRSLALKEDIFKELGYRDTADATCLVLEVDKHPPPEIIEKIVRDCRIAPERLTLILTPTRSLAGIVQIVARVLEVGLHKVHALGFPLDAIVDGWGAAPLPPPAKDFLTSMGRTNDAILFGGQVQLFVDCDDAAAEKLARELPASASRDYGKPFAQVFKEVEYDFYKIDPMLFAPAEVVVSNVTSGKSFRGGQRNEALLTGSFAGKAGTPK
jgi:methenyltetrahydromethanopterin cyclohydrolase